MTTRDLYLAVGPVLRPAVDPPQGGSFSGESLSFSIGTRFPVRTSYAPCFVASLSASDIVTARACSNSGEAFMGLSPPITRAERRDLGSKLKDDCGP